MNIRYTEFVNPRPMGAALHNANVDFPELRHLATQTRRIRFRVKYMYRRVFSYLQRGKLQPTS